MTILQLAESVHPGLTDDQWAYCITWTSLFHKNYGMSPVFVPTGDLVRIHRELQSRIEHGTDLTTIDWIWDQYIKAHPRAAAYERFRPTAPANLADFEAGVIGGNPLSELRADYKRLVEGR